MPVSDSYLSLLSGSYWYPETSPAARPVILTYSFRETASAEVLRESPAAAATFTSLSSGERQIVREALASWASASGILLLETRFHTGDINFGFYDLDLLGAPDAAGLGFFPLSGCYLEEGQPHVYSNDLTIGGDILFDVDYRSSPFFLSDFRHVALHEIGHALGLKHQFEATAENPLVVSIDDGHNSVMGYDQRFRSNELGPYDLQAAQAIYGDPSRDGQGVAGWSWDPAQETFTQVGTSATEFIRGTGARDVVFSMGGRDAIAASSGDDIIVLTGLPAEVNGGAGLDLVLTGLSFNGLGQIERDGDVRAISIGDDTQLYADVERLQFNNAIVAYDVEGHAGQAYRIYQAAFDREPDRSGLSYWVDQQDDGMPLTQVALNFMLSAEFRTTYGDIARMSNAEFLDIVYENVLHRDPDAGGLAYWTNDLEHGYPRHYLLTAFSESSENQANVLPAIQNGIILDPVAFA